MSDYKSKSEMKRVEALKVSGGPREWWLGEKVIHHGTETTYWVLSSRPDDEQIKFFGYFPVIEKSAYDALAEERDELEAIVKSATEFVIPGVLDSVDVFRGIIAERDALRAERDEQENELRKLRDEMTWTRAENSNLIEQNEKLKAALEFYADESKYAPIGEVVAYGVGYVARQALGHAAKGEG